MQNNVCVVGLGLIGGSIARRIKQNGAYTVWGVDRSPAVLSDATFLGGIDAPMQEAWWSEVDILLVALYPEDTVQFLKEHLGRLKQGCLVVDLCGVKEAICTQIAPLAQATGVHFIGGHPMAGKELFGFAYSDAMLFDGASMIFVPSQDIEDTILQQAKAFFLSLGFAKVVQCTASEHDRMIAFTSQLAHVVSSAYIKSPEALRHEGYSAGSYKDLTRVARLNETMWTELFLQNAEPLTHEIDTLIQHLQQYRDAIAKGEKETLHALLKEGRERKEKIG